MTENKPIIIDGIDVSMCERHCSDNHNRPNRCYSYITESYRDCQPKENQCNFYITSIEQQFARKTQECEELKRELMQYEKDVKDLNCFAIKLKQTLAKIKDIAKDFHYAIIPFHRGINHEIADIIDYYLNQILQIISEVE